MGADPGSARRQTPRIEHATHLVREFARRRDGMIYAMEGGLWLHRHLWKGHRMAHVVSTDYEALLDYGKGVGLPPERLQFKRLKDPRTGQRVDAWHWDLVGHLVPAPVALTVSPSPSAARPAPSSAAAPLDSTNNH